MTKATDLERAMYKGLIEVNNDTLLADVLRSYWWQQIRLLSLWPAQHTWMCSILLEQCFGSQTYT